MTDIEYTKQPCCCPCHSNPEMKHIMACCDNGMVVVPVRTDRALQRIRDLEAALAAERERRDNIEKAFADQNLMVRGLLDQLKEETQALATERERNQKLNATCHELMDELVPLRQMSPSVYEADERRREAEKERDAARQRTDYVEAAAAVMREAVNWVLDHMTWREWYYWEPAPEYVHALLDIKQAAIGDRLKLRSDTAISDAGTALLERLHKMEAALREVADDDDPTTGCAHADLARAALGTEGE